MSAHNIRAEPCIAFVRCRNRILRCSGSAIGHHRESIFWLIAALEIALKVGIDILIAQGSSEAAWCPVLVLILKDALLVVSQSRTNRNLADRGLTLFQIRCRQNPDDNTFI